MKKLIFILTLVWLFSATSLATPECNSATPCTVYITNTTQTTFPSMNVIIGACSTSIRFTDGYGWELYPGKTVYFQIVSIGPPCTQEVVKYGEYYTSEGAWARCFFIVALAPTSTGYGLADNGSLGYCKGADYAVIPQVDSNNRTVRFTIVVKPGAASQKTQ